MWFRSIIGSANSRSARISARSKKRRNRHCRAARLQLETLEARALLTFIAPVTYLDNQAPTAIASGDFTNNGIRDLVTPDNYNNTVSMRLGNGDGTFQPAQSCATGAGPVAVAVGDLTGNGRLDIVTANTLTDAAAVSVLLGKGDGTFQAPLNLSLPGVFPPGYTGTYGPVRQDPVSVAIGDMNHDGRPDLVVTADADYSSTIYASYVDVLLGDGNGGFSLASTTQVDVSDLRSVSLADVNGDGNLDVVAASPSDSRAYVLLGHGDGSLGAPTGYSTGSGPVSVAVGDINGDGRLDFATANNAGDSVSVLLGNGDGSFQPPINTALPSVTPPGYAGVSPLPLSQQPQAVVVGDLNGDGKMDLAVTARYGYLSYGAGGGYGYYSYSSSTTYLTKGAVNVLLGNGDGTFTNAQYIPLNDPGGDDPQAPLAITAANVNRDNFRDLAVADFNQGLSVLINGANWSPPTAVASSFAVSGFPTSATAGTPGNFTVTALNADGTVKTGYTGTVNFSSSDGQAAVPAVYLHGRRRGQAHV